MNVDGIWHGFVALVDRCCLRHLPFHSRVESREAVLRCMFCSWLLCCRRRSVEVDDGVELVQAPVTEVVERPRESTSSLRGVSQQRQGIARRAGLEAKAKLRGRKQKVAPVAQKITGGRLRNRVWVVLRTKSRRTLGQIFDSWSAASTHCLDDHSREPSPTAVFHGWASRFEAEIYLSTALR